MSTESRRGRIGDAKLTIERPPSERPSGIAWQSALIAIRSRSSCAVASRSIWWTSRVAAVPATARWRRRSSRRPSFRLGKWPDYFENVQFDRKPETLDQFLRSVTPNTGPYDAGVISDAMAALFNKTGSAILFSHSQAGGAGWLTAIKSENVKDRHVRV